MKFQTLTYNEFKAIYPHLPSDVALFYHQFRVKFDATHQTALKYTYQYANSQGLTVGCCGLPGHQSTKRFQLQKET